VFQSYQDIGAGLVDRGDQFLCAEVAVEQHDRTKKIPTDIPLMR
jgi:hypothetical protein